MENFKLTMEAFGRKVTYEIHEDVTITEVLDGIVSCLRGLTFYESTIIDGIKDYIKEYDD